MDGLIEIVGVSPGKGRGRADAFAAVQGGETDMAGQKRKTVRADANSANDRIGAAREAGAIVHLRGLPHYAGAASHAKQKIAKGWWRPDPGGAVNATALGSNLTAALGAIDTDARDNLRVEAHFAAAPMQLGQIDAERIEPGRLAGVMTIAALFDAARPPTDHVGSDPATFARRLVKAEMRPCVRLFGMFDHTAEQANSGERSGEASAIVALDLPLACLLDPQRLTGPKFAPPLAGRMRDDRVRAGIVASIPRLVPRINAGQAEVTATRLDVERCDCDARPIGTIAVGVVERLHGLCLHLGLERAHGFGEGGFGGEDGAEAICLPSRFGIEGVRVFSQIQSDKCPKAIFDNAHSSDTISAPHAQRPRSIGGKLAPSFGRIHTDGQIAHRPLMSHDLPPFRGGDEALKHRVGMRADGAATGFAAGHVVQSADAEIDRQAVGERVGECHAPILTKRCQPEAWAMVSEAGA